MNNHYHSTSIQQQQNVIAQQHQLLQQTTAQSTPLQVNGTAVTGAAVAAANAVAPAHTHLSYMPQANAASANSLHIPTHHHHQLHQQMRTASLPSQAYLSNVATNSTTTSNPALYSFDKRFYTTTAASATSTTHPNTILITNNYAQQQTPTTTTTLKQQPTTNNFKGNNIRIISTAPNVFNINRNTTTCTNNNNNNNIIKTSENLFPANTNTSVAQHELLSNNFTSSSQHYVTPTNALQPFYMNTQDALTVNTANLNGNCLQRVTANKLLPRVNAVTPMDVTGLAVNTASSSTGVGANNNSTVVLDRINICINNHYAETQTATISPSISASSASSINASQQPSPVIPAIQHKPIINSCHNTQYADSSSGDGVLSSQNVVDSTASNDSSNSAAVIVIDEPDSTTATPQTPPTTPDNVTPTKCTVNSVVQSPSSTTNNTTPSINLTSNNKKQLKHTFATITQTIELEDDDDDNNVNNEVDDDDDGDVGDDDDDDEMDELEIDLDQEDDDVEVVAEQSEMISNEAAQQSTTNDEVQANPDKVNGSDEPLTPSTPKTTITSVPANESPIREEKSSVNCQYSLQEDVFIKRQDGRFYLGTIIQIAQQKFLVRFDDKSELWCASEELRKLGGGQESKSVAQQPMCVACKQAHFADIVEICERCGRGYHRGCTTETLPGSGIWCCKRCAKPMKLHTPKGKPLGICRQLPYHADKLNWDEKHRVNEEQIYCYCGGSGKFDQNMLQCCKCRNWFHTACMQNFKRKLLRGDSFFVFCCTVCNNGKEFLRRLQIDWVDVLHLTLYNLRKHQHQKHHHLIKDIWPFILEQRHLMPICREWRDLPETTLMERIKQTLKDYTERFMCGRENKRDHSYYSLRQNGPPIMPQINVSSDEILTDELLTEKFKLLLLPDAKENITIEEPPKCNNVPHDTDNSKEDVYEFRVDDETSEDEIPIKQIMDKAKQKYKNSKLNNMPAVKSELISSLPPLLDVADDNANDACAKLQSTQNKKSPHKNVSPKKDKDKNMSGNCVGSVAATAGDKSIPNMQNSSRKRKAFRMSKSYKEIAAKRYDNNNLQQNNNSRNCDLSSDENSSSSRGTSLDLIIPPPVNFLGRNNPFLMVTPKKNTNNCGIGVGKSSSSSIGNSVGGIKSSIFNTTTLDFSSKLAQLKSAGIFPNLSTSELVKAAGQPRTVRTIKRRLSAKDITIGPNQEVRRRRNRRLTSHIEVISTTTINPIPSHFFPLYAKDLNANNNNINGTANQKQQLLQPPISSSSSIDSMPSDITNTAHAQKQPTHGRLLRQRPQKCSPGNSRRSSTSSNQSISTNINHNSGISSSNSSTASCGALQDGDGNTMQDLKQTVNKYFGGAINRIEAGEPYAIRAKRRLTNGQIQYLIEWGSSINETAATPATTTTTNGNNNVPIISQLEAVSTTIN